MEMLKAYYLEQLGIDCWQHRPLPALQNRLRALATQVASCRRCALHQTRSQTVFGHGNPAAKLMIIGDFPDLSDEAAGQPFSGKAGTLLINMLAGFGFDENQFYFTNILKCKPTNELASQGSMATCHPYLTQQIEQIKPAILLILGEEAGKFLLNSKDSFSIMRNTVYYYQETPTYVSFHPHTLLQNPSDKKTAYLDLLKLAFKN